MQTCAISQRLLILLWSACSAGAKVFDIFKTWRMDSGKYETEAEHVIRGWAQRCAERASQVTLQAMLLRTAVAHDLQTRNHSLNTRPYN